MHQGPATLELGEKYALEVKKLIDEAHKSGKKVHFLNVGSFNMFDVSL